MPVERLREVARRRGSKDTDLDRFTHYTCPTLPHLIALLCRPTASCIPQGTSLVVVDSLSALVNHVFPKVPETRAAADAKGIRGARATACPTAPKGPKLTRNAGPTPSARRLQVLQYIAGSLQKLAATRDVAVVVLTQCATKMQAERGATLIPAINANAWDQGVSTRLVLFRDWLWDGVEARGLHFAAVQKLNGKGTAAVVDKACAFAVGEVSAALGRRKAAADQRKAGLRPVAYDSAQPPRALSSTPAQKRKLADTDFEIADSDDDEDYGWDDDEDEIPPMPSQWQGSEDLLLTRHPESEEEDPVDDGDAADAADGEDNASRTERRD